MSCHQMRSCGKIGYFACSSQPPRSIPNREIAGSSPASFTDIFFLFLLDPDPMLTGACAVRHPRREGRKKRHTLPLPVFDLRRHVCLLLERSCSPHFPLQARSAPLSRVPSALWPHSLCYSYCPSPRRVAHATGTIARPSRRFSAFQTPGYLSRRRGRVQGSLVHSPA